MSASYYCGGNISVTVIRVNVGESSLTATKLVIGANLVFSSVHDRVLLVNGSEDLKTDNETRIWSWDGRQWTALEGSGPRVRNLAAAAFDAARQELILFGGIRPREPQDDMWAWTNGSWRRLATGRRCLTRRRRRQSR